MIGRIEPGTAGLGDEATGFNIFNAVLSAAVLGIYDILQWRKH